MNTYAKTAAWILAALLLNPQPGFAQSEADDEQESEAASSGEDSTELDDIIVTVERNESTLQGYAGTASVLFEDELKQAGVVDLDDAAKLIPGLDIGVQEGNVEVFIRGIGSDNNTELGDAAVATHYDDVYLPRPRGLGAAFFDINRVEVNIGPQGTLRGRNATGGTINIISNQPELQSFNASAEYEIGSQDNRIARAHVNIPISDTVAFRLAGYSQNRDSFYKNVGPAEEIEPAGSVDDFGLRGQLLWQPSNRFSVLLRGDYLEEGGTGFPKSDFQNFIQDGNRVDDALNPLNVIEGGGTDTNDVEHFGISAKVRYDFDDWSIEYLGSYRELDYRAKDFNGIGVAYDNFSGRVDGRSANVWRTGSDSLIQELRFFGTAGKLDWTLGGFYFNEDQQTFLGLVNDLDGFNSYLEFNQPSTETDSWSAFGDVTFNFSERLRLTAGIRYTDEEKARLGGFNAQFGLCCEDDGNNRRFGSEGFQFAIFDRTLRTLDDFDGDGIEAVNDPDDLAALFLDGIASFGVDDNVDEFLAENSRLPADGFPFLAFSILPQDGEFKDEFVDWRVRLAYDLTPNNLLYGSVSTGHKSGGINDTIAPGLSPTFDTEKLTVFEVGSKNEFMLGNTAVTMNLSGFYYDWEDQQFQILANADTLASVFPEAGDQILNFTGGLQPAFRFNGDKSEVFGAQLDGQFVFPGGMRFTYNFLYLDTEIKEATVRDFRRSAFSAFGGCADTNNNAQCGVDANGDGVVDDADNGLVNVLDLSGNRLPRVSDFQFTLSLSDSYSVPYGSFDWIAFMQHKGDQNLTVANGNADFLAPGDVPLSFFDGVDSVTTFDVAVGYTHQSGKVRLEAYIANLTDEVRANSQLSNAFSFLRFYNSPRTYGMRLRLNY